MLVSAIIHPNSKKVRVEQDLLGSLHIYVSSPPLEGKANKEVVVVLANYYQIKENKVFLVSGHKSKVKKFQILN